MSTPLLREFQRGVKRCTRQKMSYTDLSMRYSLFTALLALSAYAAAPDPKAVERGKQQFQQACGFCHGNDATGARGPDLVRSALVNRDQDGKLIGPAVKNGRPDKGMPAFAYTDAQLSDLAAFLHDQVRAAQDSNSVPRDYPVEKLATGDAGAGKTYFFGAGHCDACHSPTGDLAGIAKRYSPINLESRFLYPRGVRRSVTVTLPSGEQITGTLALIDEFNVALRDGTGWYRSWARDQVNKVDIHDPIEKHRELLYRYTDADMHNLFTYLETLK
jgi:cytochrome c oxidase cbb3-type subunit 3